MTDHSPTAAVASWRSVSRSSWSDHRRCPWAGVRPGRGGWSSNAWTSPPWLTGSSRRSRRCSKILQEANPEIQKK